MKDLKTIYPNPQYTKEVTMARLALLIPGWFAEQQKKQLLTLTKLSR